jgi:hypothetical protein
MYMQARMPSDVNSNSSSWPCNDPLTMTASMRIIRHESRHVLHFQSLEENAVVLTIVPGSPTSIICTTSNFRTNLELFDQHKMDNVNGLSSFNMACTNVWRQGLDSSNGFGMPTKLSTAFKHLHVPCVCLLSVC